MDYPSIDRLADLQQMIANFAKVKRVPMLADKGSRENDVEHSYGLALTCWYLQPKIAPELDLSKVLRYALAHDIVELHAGDTFVFDTLNVATKNKRERDAIKVVREDWRDFPELAEYAEKYMDKADVEARFVKAVDKLLPVLVIELGEKDVFWKRHNITLNMERENKKTIYVSEIVSPYYEMIIDWLDQRDNIPK